MVFILSLSPGFRGVPRVFQSVLVLERALFIYPCLKDISLFWITALLSVIINPVMIWLVPLQVNRFLGPKTTWEWFKAGAWVASLCLSWWWTAFVLLMIGPSLFHIVIVWHRESFIHGFVIKRCTLLSYSRFVFESFQRCLVCHIALFPSST